MRKNDSDSKSAVSREIRVANAEARSREEKEKAREMKTVFVFTDSMNPWETDHRMIKRKYEECGYGTWVPQMGFWKLSESTSTPVIGYSKNKPKLFLVGRDGIWNPEEVMMASISGPEYKNLQVVD